jgi:hypothetical protein
MSRWLSCGPLGAAALKTSVRPFLASRYVRLHLAKHPPLFVMKYRPKLRALCTHLRQQLRLSFHLDLNLDLNLNLYPSLYRELFVKTHQSLFRKLFAKLFGSMFVSMLTLLSISMDPALRRQRLGGRRHVGRGVGGRIVVRNSRTTTYRRGHTTVATRVASARQRAESYDFVG